jgi:hypothetical protein
MIALQFMNQMSAGDRGKGGTKTMTGLRRRRLTRGFHPLGLPVMNGKVEGPAQIQLSPVRVAYVLLSP